MVQIRDGKRVWAIVLPVALSFFMYASVAWSQQAQKLALNMTWVFNAQHAAFFLGAEKGFFKGEGIDLEILDGRGSRNNLQLLSSGKIRIALADSGTSAQFITQGLAAKVVYVYFPKSPMSIVAHEDRNIRTPKDLEGKRIGRVPASSNTALFPAVAKSNGLNLSKITFVNATFATLASAFLKGEMDAVLLHFPDNVANLRAKGAKVNFIRYSDAGANTLGEGVTVSTPYLSENASMVRSLLRAISKSFLYTQNHRNEAIAALQKAAPLTAKNLQAARETLDGYLTLLQTKKTEGKPLGWMAKADWQETIQILEKYAEMKNPLPAERYYTNDFVPALK